MFGMSWSGPESTKESPRGIYILVKAATWIWVGLWACSFLFGLYQVVTQRDSIGSIGSVVGGFLANLLMGAFTVALLYGRRRYLAHLRITPEGLAIEQVSGRRVVPFAQVTSVRPLLATLWQMRLSDGSEPIAFITGGSQVTLFFRTIRAKSKFVDAVMLKVAEAKEAEQHG